MAIVDRGINQTCVNSEKHHDPATSSPACPRWTTPR
jgi:hypothetical protein